LENLVYLELRKAGYEVYIGVFRKGEVDFVAIQGDTRGYKGIRKHISNVPTCLLMYKQ